MKKIILITAFTFMALLAQAQEDSIRFIHSVGLGYQYTQFDGLSGQMQTTFGNDYNIDAGAFSINLACYTICHRFMFGGEFGGLQRKVQNDDFMSTTISQGFGYFNFGYLVIDKPGCLAFPFVGIGGVYTGMVLKNKSAANWFDEDYIIRSGQRGNFYSGGGSINAGISYRKICKHTHHGKQLQIGADLGVHITPQRSDWMYAGSDETVQSFGHSNNVGYYARLTIGGLMSRTFDKSDYRMK